MSVGTAMVIIAVGVFFYLKPEIFKASVKVGAVVIGVAGLAVGGYYAYQHWQDAKGKSKFDLATARPVSEGDVGATVSVSYLPSNSINDLPSYSVMCKNGRATCDPWDRDWSKVKPLLGYAIDQTGSYLNNDGSVMTVKQENEAMGKQLIAQGFCKFIGNPLDQFDEHPKYPFKCNDDNTYEMSGPKGSTPEEAIVELVRRYPWLPDPIVNPAPTKAAGR